MVTTLMPRRSIVSTSCVVDGARHVVHAVRHQVEQRVDVAGRGDADRGPVGQYPGVAPHFLRAQGVDAHHVEVVAVEKDAERPLSDVAG